ncbi:unnamed protein product [Brachionus calyciflorus]|uniref:FLYWCH-type domain-containing protein n=1 Tax=Brachionus calyciflorus TaxID=104777 RepID=A0A814JBN7_9BILA|nr:unnamed protein product [Brachionus calyciflorus]
MEISTIEIVNSSKEKPMIVINNFIYHKNQDRKNGNIYCRCQYCSSKYQCPASVTTEGLNTQIVCFSIKQHVDYPFKEDIDIKVLNKEDKMRKRSRSEQIPIRQIYRSEMYNLIVETQDIENIPKLPKEKNEIDLTNPRFTSKSYSKPFLLFDTNDKDRITAFASDIQLEILAKSARWHIDGKFKSCPNLYKQLYIIHARLNEEMFAFNFLKEVCFKKRPNIATKNYNERL